MPKKYLIIALICFALKIQAKNHDTTGYYDIFLAETRIKEKAPLIITGENDSIRLDAALILFHSLDSLLRMPAAWFYPFDSLKMRTVSILKPADGKFRLFSFNMISLAGNFKNFGFLEVKNGSDFEIYPLLDTAKKLKKDYAEEELGTEEWSGTLYYDIVPFKLNRKKNYLLLGFDGSTANSNKKIIDVLWFDKGTPVFGKSIFKDGTFDTKPACRVVYEYHNESQMLLRYEPKRKILVLDKLNPSFPDAVNDFAYYIPSGDYDYYKLDKKGFWVKDALENFDLGQGEKPKGPVEKPKPEPIYMPEEKK